MPMDKTRYPANWASISQSVKERACWQCEWIDEQGSRCTRKHGEPIPGNEQRKTILTTAHLDHDTENNDLENLRAYCQLHHLRYDASIHAQHAKETRRKKQRALYDEVLA